MNIAKQAAAKAAAALIQDGMVVGLGTGSTANYFIAQLGARFRQGLDIKVVTTSQTSLEKALKEGIPTADVNDYDKIDVDVDGADEVDADKRMIKGGGGALFREKIVASMSTEMIVIIDESKKVSHLGKFPLPVEVSPFGHRHTLAALKQKGYPARMRMGKEGSVFMTENGNYIADVQLRYPCSFPDKDDLAIRGIPGVIETGFFIGFAGRVLVGFADGHCEEM